MYLYAPLLLPLIQHMLDPLVHFYASICCVGKSVFSTCPLHPQSIHPSVHLSVSLSVSGCLYKVDCAFYIQLLNVDRFCHGMVDSERPG